MVCDGGVTPCPAASLSWEPLLLLSGMWWWVWATSESLQLKFLQVPSQQPLGKGERCGSGVKELLHGYLSVGIIPLILGGDVCPSGAHQHLRVITKEAEVTVENLSAHSASHPHLSSAFLAQDRNVCNY